MAKSKTILTEVVQSHQKSKNEQNGIRFNEIRQCSGQSRELGVIVVISFLMTFGDSEPISVRIVLFLVILTQCGSIWPNPLWLTSG